MDNKKNLLLITNGFPYGESERGFLPTEFAELTARFSVRLLAMENDAPLRYPLPEGVCADRFFYKPFPKTPGTLLRCVRHLFYPGMLPELARAARGCGLRMALRRWRDILGTSLSASQLEAGILRSLWNGKKST